MQAREADRAAVDDIARIHVRNASGEMVPVASVARVRVHRRSAVDRPLQQLPLDHAERPAGARASPPGRRSPRWQHVGATLPPGYGYEWTGTALQELEAAGQTTTILALAVLFAYLFLVALYESWTIPMPVLLSVVVGVARRLRLDARRRAVLRHLCPDRPGGADRARLEERES